MGLLTAVRNRVLARSVLVFAGLISSDLRAATLGLRAVRDGMGLSTGLAVMGCAICVLRRLKPSIVGAALRGTG